MAKTFTLPVTPAKAGVTAVSGVIPLAAVLVVESTELPAQPRAQAVGGFQLSPE